MLSPILVPTPVAGLGGGTSDMPERAEVLARMIRLRPADPSTLQHERFGKGPVRVTCCLRCPCLWESSGCTPVCRVLSAVTGIALDKGVRPDCPLEDWKL